MAKRKKTDAPVANPSNAAAASIESSKPYTAEVTVKGVCDILFHRYNPEEVAHKASLPRGDAGKKIDNLEAAVYRDQDGHICIPTEYLRRACVEIGRNHRDPRSARKMARDLWKAIIIPETNLVPIMTPGLNRSHDQCDAPPFAKEWEYVDKRRVNVQQSAVTRHRPAFSKGWEAVFRLTILQPNYLDSQTFHKVVQDAGQFQGIGDFRPTFGRFAVIRYEVLQPEPVFNEAVVSA